MGGGTYTKEGIFADATMGSILMSADGKNYVYGYHRALSDLHLVGGLK